MANPTVARLVEFDGVFKHGDVVKLKSSATKMTVENTGGNGWVLCVWFDRDKLCRERFTAHTLELAS